MFKVIFTKSLNSADDMVSESWEYTEKKDAIASFNEKLQNIFDDVKNNPLLNAKFSIHQNKAFVEIEQTRYCLIVLDDLNGIIHI